MAATREPPETRRLREFHALGKKVLEVDRDSEPLAGGRRRRGVAKQFQKKRGLSRDQVEKARKFAAMYSEEELEALCSLNVSRTGKSVTKCHVIRLLAVHSKRTRRRLEKQAVRHGWSVQRLGQEITKSGKSSQGGRRPKRPATVDEALGHIERLAQQWVRWAEMMEDSDGDESVGTKDLPGPVALAVGKMTRSANSVAATMPHTKS